MVEKQQRRIHTHINSNNNKYKHNTEQIVRMILEISLRANKYSCRERHQLSRSVRLTHIYKRRYWLELLIVKCNTVNVTQPFEELKSYDCIAPKAINTS